MKKQSIAIAIATGVTFVGSAFAQQRMEAVVTVTKVDPASRIVWIKAKSATRALQLSPGMDMFNLQVGSRYQMLWTESVAMAVEPDAQSAAVGANRQADIGKTGSRAGTSFVKLAGVIDSMDAHAKKLTLRTRDGDRETFSMGANVTPASFKTGDTVTLTFQRALAWEMRWTPHPVSEPAPAP